jgi:hypothetical protein
VNIYRMLGRGIGTPEAHDLAERLSAWHDAMVAHERRIDRTCDEECPHADAGFLWGEATDTFGERARELVFLQSRASRRAKRAASARLSV